MWNKSEAGFHYSKPIFGQVHSKISQRSDVVMVDLIYVPH